MDARSYRRRARVWRSPGDAEMWPSACSDRSDPPAAITVCVPAGGRSRPRNTDLESVVAERRDVLDRGVRDPPLSQDIDGSARLKVGNRREPQRQAAGRRVENPRGKTVRGVCQLDFGQCTGVPRARPAVRCAPRNRLLRRTRRSGFGRGHRCAAQVPQRLSRRTVRHRHSDGRATVLASRKT